jgi:hypothetical protein
MELTAVGVDVAKRVFQLHWVEPETGEIVSRARTIWALLAHDRSYERTMSASSRRDWHDDSISQGGFKVEAQQRI